MEILPAVRWLGSVLLIGGLAAIVVARRRKRIGDRTAPSLQRVGLWSAIIGFLTVAAVSAEERMRRSPPATKTAIITDNHFEATTQPAIRIVAPPGWAVSFEPTNKVVTVEYIADEDEQWVTLGIRSSVITDRVDLTRMAEALKELPAPIDTVILAGPELTELAGRPALRTVFEHPGAGLVEVAWEVERGPHYASQVHCIVHERRAPLHACDGPLRSLRWIDPTDVGGAASR